MGTRAEGSPSAGVLFLPFRRLQKPQSACILTISGVCVAQMSAQTAVDRLALGSSPLGPTVAPWLTIRDPHGTVPLLILGRLGKGCQSALPTEQDDMARWRSRFGLTTCSGVAVAERFLILNKLWLRVPGSELGFASTENVCMV